MPQPNPWQMQPTVPTAAPLASRVELTAEQNEALKVVEFGAALGCLTLVTGKAGTGKSTVLRRFIEATEQKCVVLAPTGLAAIQVGGQTIHSFFNFPLGPLTNSPDLVPTFRKGGAKRRLIERLEVVVIDETSMVRADVFDAIDFSLRQNRDSDLPFGGVRVVGFGDLWQLEPVVTGGADAEMIGDRYASAFFFDARVVVEAGLDVVHLTEVHRQADPDFIFALNRLRRGDCSELNLFNQRVGVTLEDRDTVTLTATNGRADSINQRRLSQLAGPTRFYAGSTEGDFVREFPADPRLGLRLGAQVMFVKNGRQWVNGTIGQVTALGDDEIEVTVNGNERLTVTREKWEKVRYAWDGASSRIGKEIVGEYVQFPLRLAWAVTIHKAQGLTFDRVVVDLDRPAFAHGQVYVALSRCRSLDGLALARPIKPTDLVVNDRVWEFERMAGISESD
ncbi:MAG: AAA family ATPase [Fimbriimonadaceae bacterium]|nr:AAA family ATPase [Fimbriimonadaceae bacterium]QYK57037.1 MAG: AAA family ATPase [Fimbriimonadaceae bacterium]